MVECVCLVVISFSPAEVAHSRMRLRYHLVVGGVVVGRVGLVGSGVVVVVVGSVGCVLILALGSASWLELAFGVGGGVGRAGGGFCARCWGSYGGFGLLMAVNPMV